MASGRYVREAKKTTRVGELAVYGVPCLGDHNGDSAHLMLKVDGKEMTLSKHDAEILALEIPRVLQLSRSHKKAIEELMKRSPGVSLDSANRTAHDLTCDCDVRVAPLFRVEIAD